MANLTLVALSLSSLSHSPFVQVSHRTQFFSLFSSRLTRFPAPFLYLSTDSHVHLARSRFSHFLESPVTTSRVHLRRLDYDRNHTNFSPEPDLIVDEMTFDDCESQFDGGAIFVIFQSYLICNFSAFSNCRAGNKGGAIFCVAPIVKFEGSCFQNCVAKIGSSVFSPDCEVNMSFEQCFVDQVDNNAGHAAVLGFGHDLLFSRDNFSRLILSASAITLETDHSIRMFQMTFQNITTEEGILMLTRVQNDHELNETNVIDCKSSSSLIVVRDYNPVFDRYVFSGSECEYYFNATGHLVLSECVFDLADDKAVADSDSLTKEIIDCQFNQATPEFNTLDIVSTQECWFHSRYVWHPPTLWVQIVVGVAICVIVLGGLLGIIIHSCVRRHRHKQEKEKQKRMKGWCAKVQRGASGAQAVQVALLRHSLVEMAVQEEPSQSSLSSESVSDGNVEETAKL